MRSLFILMVIMFFLFSCDKDEYFYIPEDEKPLLKTNDTVVFIDTENQKLDSFLIKRFESYNVMDKRYYYERIYIRYQKMGKTTPVKDFFIQQSLSTSISINGNYFPANYSNNEEIINITISGIDYQSVFVLNTTNFPDSIPNTVYYSQQYGIIKYSFPDGRYYELNSKIQ